MNSLIHNSTFYICIEKIYDAHAANMYGCIFKIVQDKTEADKILTIVFQDFLNDFSSDVQTKTAPIWFINYAMKSTFNYLKQYDVNNVLSSSILERILTLKKDIAPMALSHA